VRYLIQHPLRIDGVEVTQAIQYYHADRHLTNPAVRGNDNSVRLVANKPAWIRVYVGSVFTNLRNVTGTVEVQRETFGGYETLGNLSPEPPGTTTAQTNPDYAIQRRTISSTLNFIIPADYMLGYLVLNVRVRVGSSFDEREVSLDVTLKQTLRISGIMISYNGSNGDVTNPANIAIAAPTLGDLQATAPFTLTTYPVESTAAYRIAGTITWTTPLTDLPTSPGGCTPNWNSLNNIVQQARVNDGNRRGEVYYGLLPIGIPVGPIGGCSAGTGGVGTGPSHAEGAMAHEIGHSVGLFHAPCSVPGDPNYPAYEPYDPAGTPMASIGEYGLDIRNGNILDPLNSKDYMSYCGPGWISLYHYGKLLNNRLLNPVIVGRINPLWYEYILVRPLIIPEKWPPEDLLIPPEWIPDPPPDIKLAMSAKMNPVPLISIIGIVRSDKEVIVQSVVRLHAFRELPDTQPTDFLAELIDADGKTLASAPLYYLPSYGHCGCCRRETYESPPPPPYSFQAFVTNVSEGAELRVSKGEKIIWARHAPNTPPKIQSFNATIEEDTVSVNWEINSATQQEPEAWLQWSSDNGKSWYGLTISLTGKQAKVDMSVLPSGSALIRLLASDGFYTATSDPIEVKVPVRPPSIVIFNPREGSKLQENSTLRLWGTGTHSSSKPVDPTSARWLIDDKEVAHGLDAFITAPKEGEHTCTLIIEANGQTNKLSIKFQTLFIPQKKMKRGRSNK
jgi:hypothetical protein